MNVYCKNCKHRDGHWFHWCTKELKKESYSKYNDELLSDGQWLDITNNNDGNCKYYEPTILKRIINATKRRIK